MGFKIPQGPMWPVFNALEEIEVFRGWISAFEESAKIQFEALKNKNADFVIDGQHIKTHHGLDGVIWSLDHLFGEHFPAIQRSSAFLSIWASLERQMTQLCGEISKTKQYRLTINDLSGKGLYRCRQYLLKVAELDGEWAHSCWEEFPHFMSIRNAFAHDNGCIYENRNGIIDYIKNSKHMYLDEDRLILNPTFLIHFLDSEQSFLNSLWNTVTARFGDDT